MRQYPDRRIRPANRHGSSTVNAYDRIALGQRIYHQPTLHQQFRRTGYSSEATHLHKTYLLTKLAIAVTFVFGIIVCMYAAS